MMAATKRRAPEPSRQPDRTNQPLTGNTGSPACYPSRQARPTRLSGNNSEHQNLTPDNTLLNTALNEERSFRKMLSYNGSAAPMASLIFTDTAPAIAAFIDRPAGDVDGDDTSLIAGLPVWNWRTDEDMPDLPSPMS
ncbi:hypothetical protein [Mycobacterium sp. NPDC004974]